MNRALISASSLALLLLSGCGDSGEPKVEVEQAWVRLPATPGGAGAGYFAAKANRSDEALLSAAAPGTRIEMHESMTMNHMSSMQPLATAPFEGGRLKFAPGGKHLMIFGLDPALKAKGAIPLTLHFKSAPPVTIAAKLIGAGDSPPAMATDRAGRPLTEGEKRLAQSVFGDAIDYALVRIVRRKWWPFQPKQAAMAPTGNIHFHPQGSLWSDDFAAAELGLQALFVHEMTHVWQAQSRGRFYLPLMRHPFCRYDYSLKPGQKFERYGIEQQGEIMRHFFLLREGACVPNAPPLDRYLAILPFHFVGRREPPGSTASRHTL